MNAPAASILVIDDEPDLRTLYELTLLREGYRVETASTVQEARACPTALAWRSCKTCGTSNAANAAWS